MLGIQNFAHAPPNCAAWSKVVQADGSHSLLALAWVIWLLLPNLPDAKDLPAIGNYSPMYLGHWPIWTILALFIS